MGKTIRNLDANCSNTRAFKPGFSRNHEEKLARRMCCGGKRGDCQGRFPGMTDYSEISPERIYIPMSMSMDTQDHYSFPRADKATLTGR